MDAFNVAFRIPNLVRDLFAGGRHEGGLSCPLHAYVEAARREEAWRLGSLVVSALIA